MKLAIIYRSLIEGKGYRILKGETY